MSKAHSGLRGYESQRCFGCFSDSNSGIQGEFQKLSDSSVRTGNTSTILQKRVDIWTFVGAEIGLNPFMQSRKVPNGVLLASLTSYIYQGVYLWWELPIKIKSKRKKLKEVVPIACCIKTILASGSLWRKPFSPWCKQGKSIPSLCVLTQYIILLHYSALQDSGDCGCAPNQNCEDPEGM